MRRLLPALACLWLTAAAPVPARPPLVVGFDFSRSAIDVEVTVRGVPLHMLLDTGVDPSVVDLARAETLGLHVDRSDGGEASGFGEGQGAAIYPAQVEGLAIGGRGFAPFDALASDMASISRAYGRKLDGILGYSFLADKITLIDYPAHTLAILDRAADARALTRGCGRRWRVALKTIDGFPVIPGFRFGRASGPVTYDTGYNAGIALFGSALALPGLRDALKENGSVAHTGARGTSSTTAYAVQTPVGFGPFTLPPGQPVMLHKDAGSAERIANIGNAIPDAMRLKVLLDYPGKAMTFYGDCR